MSNLDDEILAELEPSPSTLPPGAVTDFGEYREREEEYRRRKEKEAARPPYVRPPRQPERKSGWDAFFENVGRMAREQAQIKPPSLRDAALDLFLGPLRPAFDPRTEFEREFIATPVERAGKALTLPFQATAGVAMGLERGVRQGHGITRTIGEMLGGGIERVAKGVSTLGETFTPEGQETPGQFMGRGIRETFGLSKEESEVLGKAFEIAGEVLAFPGAPKDISRLSNGALFWMERMRKASKAERIALTGTREFKAVQAELKQAAQRFETERDFLRQEKGALGEIRGQRADVRESIREGIEQELKREPLPPDLNKIILREMGVEEAPAAALTPPIARRPPAGMEAPPRPAPAGAAMEMLGPVRPAAPLREADTSSNAIRDILAKAEEGRSRGIGIGDLWRQAESRGVSRADFERVLQGLEREGRVSLFATDEATRYAPQELLPRKGGLPIYAVGPGKKAGRASEMAATFAEGLAREVPDVGPGRAQPPSIEEVAGFTLPAYSRSVPAPSSVPGGAGATMSPAQARRSLTDVTALITRQGGQATEFSQSKGLMGFYSPKTRDVVTRRLNDGTFWHEFGHWLEETIAGAGKGPSPFLRGQAGATLQHLAGELDPLSAGLKVTKVSSKTSEGFAEFLRFYATNPDHARKLAPKTAAWLETTAIHANDETAKAIGELRKIQAALKSYSSAPIMDRLGTMIVKHGEVAVEDVRAAVSPVTSAINTIADDTAIVAEMARRAGLSPATDPAEWALRARNTPHAYWTEKGTLDFNTRAVNGPSVQQIVKTAGDQDLFKRYLLAREFVELYKARGIPPPTEFLEPWLIRAEGGDHARIIRQLEEAVSEVRAKHPNVAEAADKLFQRHADARLEYMNEGGVIGADDITRMKRTQYYAPTRRSMEYSREVEEQTEKGLGFLKRKSKKGSLREILDPIQQTVLDDGAALKRTAVNQVGIGLIRIVDNVPQEAARWGLRLADPNKVPKVALKGMLEDIVGDVAKLIGMTPEEAAIRLGLDEIDLLEQVKIWRIFEEAPEGRQYMRVLNKPRADGTRHLPKYGDEIWLEVPKDVRAMLAAPEGADSAFWKISDAITGTFTRATTGHVAFGIADFFRNIPNAAIMSPGVGAGVSAIPGVSVGQALGRGAVGLAARVAPKITGLEKWMDLYRRLDTSRSTFQAQAGRLFSPGVESAITGKRTTIRKLVGAIFDDGSRAFSDAIRVGEVRAKVLKEGWDINNLTPDQLAVLSKAGREIGTDFSKRGAALQAVARLTPFLRPAIGGEVSLWRNLGRGMAKNPLATTSALFSSVAMPSALLWYVNHDQPWYRDRPEDERRNYWMFKVGEQVFRIPKPPGSIGTLATLAELALDMAFGENPRATTEALHAFLGLGSSFIPLGSNPVARWVVERVFGVRFDAEALRKPRPIIPRGMENLPPELQAYPEQGPTVRTLAKTPGLGDLFGRSPIQFERSLTTFTGPLGRYGLQTSDVLARLFGAEEKKLPTEARGLPVLSRFLGPAVPTSTPSRDQLYEDLAELELVKKRIKAAVETGDLERARTLEKENEDLLRREKEIERIVKHDRRDRAAIRAIRAQEGLSPEERLRKMRDLQTRSNEAVRRALTPPRR